MKIHIFSDLHLEFGAPFTVPPAEADILVLAGDIHSGTQGLDWAASIARGRPVIYVAGNHEFYGHHLHGTAVAMRKVAKELGIHYLDNDELVLDGVRFLGTTLWTSFTLNGLGEVMFYSLRVARQQMNDFSTIRYGSTGWFLPEQSVILHRAARAWLEKTLVEPFDGPTVVVTHHCPHSDSVPTRFQANSLSPAFASDLSDIIEQYRPALWIHGHTHDAFDYWVGTTRVVCNPRGYPGERTNGFDAEKVVEV